MSTSDRFRRPEPERTHPIRDVSGLFQQAWSRSAGAAPWVPWWSAFPMDAAARGVREGYRVADEQFGTDSGADGEREAGRTGPFSSMPGPEDVQNLTMRMWRYAADMMWLWFDLMGAVSRGQAPQAWPGARPNGSSESTAAAASQAPATAEEKLSVGVEVASRSPVRVHLALDPGTDGPLVVQKLRDLTEELEPIAGAAVTCANGVATVRLHVPNEQPPGRYSGSVLAESTGLPVGNLSVEVLGPAKTA